MDVSYFFFSGGGFGTYREPVIGTGVYVTGGVGSDGTAPRAPPE
jgi:hypothetical protein